jgi:allantoin racemase
MHKILVVNPNSLEEMTRDIDAAVAPLRIPGGPSIECITLADGPPGIETQQQMDAAIGPLVKLVREREHECSAFVIACYSDPGMQSMREATRKPVLGIAESGILTALTLGQRFGVIAMSHRSPPRQLRYIGAMGVTSRLARILPLDLGVAELLDEKRTFGRLVEVGKALRAHHGADVIVMACAGMSPYRDRLQAEVGVPIVEPTQAAVGLALTRVRLNWEGV